MSTAEHQDSSGRKVFPPDEALRRAEPLPPPERMALEDVSDDDWTAFQEGAGRAVTDAVHVGVVVDTMVVSWLLDRLNPVLIDTAS